jgi:hypothetical protein
VIYAVTRRYMVEEIVYVHADSPTEARQKVEDADWIDQTAAETVSPSTYRKATPRPDLVLDYEGNVISRDSAYAPTGGGDDA